MLASPSVPDSCAWHASTNTLSLLGTGPESATREIALKGVTATAMNGSDCGVWAIANGQLYRYDANAEPAWQVPLQSIDKKLGNADQLVIDPYDDSVWITEQKVLAHLAADGSVIGTWPTPGVIRTLTLALDRSVWILGNKLLWHYSAQGELLATHDLHQTVHAAPKQIAIDSLGNRLWLAGEKQLTLLDSTQPDQPPHHIDLPHQVVGLALNPLAGELWVVTKDGQLLAYNRDAALLRTINLHAHDLGTLAHVAFDPASQTLWIASDRTLARFSADGDLIAILTGRNASAALAAPAFKLAPALALVRPPHDALTNNPQPTISYSVDALCNEQPCTLTAAYFNGYSLDVKINQQAIGPFAYDSDTRQASHTPASRLPEGQNTLAAQAKDGFGNLSDIVTDHFTIDTIPPGFVDIAPPSGSVFTEPQVTLQGTVDDIEATVVLDGIGVAPVTAINGTALAFSFPLDLVPSANTFTLSAIDKAGNIGTASITLTFTPPPPPAPVAANIVIGTPSNGMATLNASAGTVHPGSNVVVTNTRTNEIVTVQADSSGAFSASITAQTGDALTVTAVNQWGGASPVVQFTVSGATDIPPDPAQVASPIDPTVPTQIAASTAFLYSGPNPIQTGVEPGTIEARRVAVLRGKVADRDNQPLPGVTITVLNHPELGQTKTRADGMFDIAVNGGGTITLNYEKAGFLPAQRQINTTWQDYTWAPDVVLIPLDAQVTTIDLATATTPQLASGAPVTDADGTRQAVMLFQPGTTAEMVLPDGSVQALTTLNVRATEYTVGANGPQTMPGPLPPTSGYTYAVELSVDEAIAAGATTVRFSKPVITYVDNFLNFPVGGIVPVGYYDRQKAAWVPAPNGRIVKLLGVANGLAELDVTGSGAPSSATELAQLGITEAERQQLAGKYQPGQSFWRVPIDHFTPWDCNWPYGPPPGAEPPQEPPKEDNKDEKPCEKDGSIIECQNQVLGERIPVAGTPFTLNYRSDRVPGRAAANTIHIPITGDTVHADLQGVEVEILVAGQRRTHRFSADPGQTYTFTWDGLDGYGRPLQGSHQVTVRVGNVYPAAYQAPAQFGVAFAAYPSGTITSNRDRQEVTIWRESRHAVGQFDLRGPGLGGWSLDARHAYQPDRQVLLLGDGRQRSAQNLDSVITTVAGNGVFNFAGDGGAATAASLNYPTGVTVDAQGSLYIADMYNQRIRKITPDGVITTVAGNGSQGFAGDGGAATAASLFDPYGVAVDAQSNLYVADYGNRRIRKVTPDGVITTVAGNGSQGFAGDGGAATAASLDSPSGVAVDAQGSLYIADMYNQRIRKVTPDGVITTVAGNGLQGFAGDGGAAAAASLFKPMGVAVDAQGNLYVADYGNRRIRKVTPDGVITTVAGNGSYGVFDGDGDAATAASLDYPTGVTVDAQGRLYIPGRSTQRIRKVTPDGVITTVAGNGSVGFAGNGGAATAARLYRPEGVTVDAQGKLYVADAGNARIRKVTPRFPALAADTLVIAAEDGSSLHHFDAGGRHLKTIDARTGTDLYSFTYSTEGLLSEIHDADGNITRIERDADGKPQAIIAPDGQRTTLALDPNGYLASLANPAAETWQMTYTDDGLLTRIRNPRGHASEMTYDSDGRLIEDLNAAEGGWTLARTDLDEGFEVAMTTAMGRITTHRTENLPTGDRRKTTVASDGTQHQQLIQTNGTTVTTSTDGTITTSTDGPDPRFGMQSPIAASTIVKTPSGLTGTVTLSRAVTLSNPSDLLSLLTQTDTVTLNGKAFKTVYNATQRQLTSTSPLNRQTLVQTDAQGRVLQEQVTGLEPVNYTYDTRGRLTAVTQGSGSEARSLTTTYDAQGNVASVTDTLGRTTSYTHDLAGRIKTTALPDGRVIAFAYDGNGNVTSITPPSRPAHGFDYNAVDLATGYAPPALGSEPVATQYAYNLDKDLTNITRPDGQTVNYAYDAGGRLATVTAPHGTLAYSYHAASGQLATIAAPGGIGMATTYDGFLPTATAITGPVPGSLSTGYDNFFRINRLGVNGSNITFGYDADGLLTQAGSLTLTRSPANGLVTGSTLGQITTSQEVDSFGQLARLTARQGSTVLYNEQYSRDKAGRVTSKSITLDGVAHVYAYTYDSAGRLTDVTKNGNPAGHFDYDANGNRTLAYGIAASYDAQDRLVHYGGAAISHTANGEINKIEAGSSVTEYTYDVFGNLKQARLPDGTQLGYLVDGRNRRIGKTINGTLTQGFLYQDQLKPAAELDGNGNVTARFVYAGKANVPEYMIKGGNTYRIVTDQLGSVRLVVDAANGQVVQRIDYDDWGNVQHDSNPGFQPFGFAGGLYDRHTKLVRFGARDYSPQFGRWTAKDPIGFGGGDTSLYAYVEGNPVSYVDPLGLWSVTVEGYRGVGGGVTFGRDPNTGQPFMTMRAGWGSGGGIKWDKNGGRPGSEGLTNACVGNGAGVGVFADVDFNVGPLQAGLQNSLGTNSGTGTYSQFMSPTWSLGDSWGIKAGVSAGAQLTVWTPDVRGGR